MRIFRLASITVGLVFFVLLIGCGETYRPVVNPFPTPGGDPQFSTNIMVVNQGVKADPDHFGVVLDCQLTDKCPGTISQLDVPGDMNLMTRVLGDDPWGIFSGGFLLTANRASNTVSQFSIGSPTVSTVSLPNSVDALVDSTNTTPITVTGPIFIGASANSGDLFLTMPACKPPLPTAGVCATPDTQNPGVVSVVSVTTGFSKAYRVGNYPIAVVEPLNNSKVYVLNFSSSSIDVFAGIDRARVKTLTGDGSNGISFPVYGVAKPDSTYVFILNRGINTLESRLSVINTTNDSVVFSPSLGVGAPSGTADLTPPANPLNHPLSYDNAKQWLWVTNPNDDSVTVFDATGLSASTPAFSVKRKIPQCASADSTNCFPPGTAPISVTPLPDGTRAYVLGAGSSGVAPSVYMIDTNAFAVTPVSGYIGTSPRGIVASADSTKVYVINHDPTTEANSDPNAPTGSVVTTQPPGTNVITTSNNSFLKNDAGRPLTVLAPFQDALNCSVDTPEPWAPNHLYSANSTIVSTPLNGHAYQATVAGKSGGSEPSFCTADKCTVTDGAVTWREIGAPRACPRQRPNLVIVP